SYFDLDSDVFYTKLQKALNPISKIDDSTNNEARQFPNELYGFAWITGTLIFLMFVSSTGSKLLSQWLHGSDDTSYTYDFELLIKAISLFYGYNFLVPVLLYVVTTYYYKFPHVIQLVQTISIFGYTNVLWIPITLVNLIIVVLISNNTHGYVLNILEWLIVAANGLITGLSNIVKLSPIIKKNCDDLASDKLYYGIIGVMAIVHLGFTVVVKFSFFGV
ncbi:hypothetical protein G210_5796, partial [Candida maltosa Xu316]